mmetsp:Transcript_36494/g.56032  ORF Transcript_36494/g.56032 Transcript_36494/m.56032 type:complete len:86 (-) Transcript_36494:1448-1705(-)
MAMISPSLRTQVTKYIFMGAVQLNPIFKTSADKLDFLIKDVTTQLFMPEDTIIFQGEESHNLYLIAKGECKVWVNSYYQGQVFVR